MNTNRVKGQLKRLTGTFNVGIVTIGHDNGSLPNVSIAIGVSSVIAIVSFTSIIISVLPRASRACHIFGSTLFSHVGGNILFIGMKHNTAISDSDLVGTLSGKAITCTTLSIFSRRPLPTRDPL